MRPGTAHRRRGFFLAIGFRRRLPAKEILRGIPYKVKYVWLDAGWRDKLLSINPMNKIFWLMAVAALMACAPFMVEEAQATQIFADQTGKNCNYCHIGRPDNLEFTPDGDLFVKNYYRLPGTDDGASKTGLSLALERKIRRILLAVHAAAAVALAGAAIFFGFVPRPMAREDLPPGERRFIWSTMGLAILCGALLVPFVYQPDVDFWHSTYGAFLGLKVVLTNFLVLVMTFRLIVARQTSRVRKKAEVFLVMPGFSRTQTFSAADLKHFNGRKGRRALIAYKGKVYDVTNARHWNNGLHQNKHTAGADLTGGIATAPHGEAVLEAAKEVGTYDALLTASCFDELRRLDAHVRRFNTFSRASAAVAAALAVTLAFWHQ